MFCAKWKDDKTDCVLFIFAGPEKGYAIEKKNYLRNEKNIAKN